jgi:hypothetical protein
MPTPDRPDPRTTLTARTVRTVRRRSGPVHVITTLPAARLPVTRTPVIRTPVIRTAPPDRPRPRGWTVRVCDAPVEVCAYPPMTLWSAWALARSARRCWPEWQTHLTRADRDERGSGDG